jgi:hypothetical protein
VKIAVKLITAQRKTADVGNSKLEECRNTTYLRGCEEGKLASYKIEGRRNMQGSAE